jgi:UDP-N-acetylmuramate--alanine ligase
MKIGIFFGGQSREREISFAGGRTVYDNLNKDLFEAIPVFIDSTGNFILLDWECIYKGTIRDFYPPVSESPISENHFQLYIESLGELNDEAIDQIVSKVGKRIYPHQFKNYFDFAFLALHGPYGEDGNIQGILEWNNIPYSGAGILPSAIGINKLVQKDLMKLAGFIRPDNQVISKTNWLTNTDRTRLFIDLKSKFNLPLVIKSPYQGSSIGVSVISKDDVSMFEEAVNKSFFIQRILASTWNNYSNEQKVNFIRELTDIRVGIGLPVYIDNETVFNPDQLLIFINNYLQKNTSVLLQSVDGEEEVLIEKFIKGREFSCIVIQDEQGHPIALPPTEIIKGNDVFDYRSKYLPGMSRKVTPIDLPEAEIEKIRKSCSDLYSKLHFNVYARLDGFYTEKGEIFLNDPNTTSGMLPSSFFFHQAAEIGLNPSQFLTYIIRTSLAERIKTGKKTRSIHQLLHQLDDAISHFRNIDANKIKVAVIMGGYSSERHISVESGRNIYEKLASSSKYEPIPIFLTGSDEAFEMYEIPVNVMLKDNADDIKEKVLLGNKEPKHPIIHKIMQEAAQITAKYVTKNLLYPEQISFTQLAAKVQRVFIALHGRPGEDGALQVELEKVNLPYNGSGIVSSQTTINKYETNKTLREHGVLVANHRLVNMKEWLEKPKELIDEIEKGFNYPFIAKPADDGCSSAVKKIHNRVELIAFTNLIFREEEGINSSDAQTLKLKYKEEFPLKKTYLIEDLITKGKAQHFLEVTGGMLTKFNENGEIIYEIFEPSETLASGEVLSLEEKFLAGEGQNITPSRFSKDPNLQQKISESVRAELAKVAKILNVQGYCRIDAFVRIFEDGKAETVIIEINSLPGMTPATCIFHQCAINHYKPYDFIDNILDFGAKRVAFSNIKV